MAGRPVPAGEWSLTRPVRCGCGHLPTHHMVVVPVGASANYRLEASGPCAICGEATCRHYAPVAG